MTSAAFKYLTPNDWEPIRDRIQIFVCGTFLLHTLRIYGVRYAA